MTYHELKCWPRFYIPVADESKPFEVRRNDRDPQFARGDVLFLREWNLATKSYTGYACLRLVTFVLLDHESEGIKKGYAILGIKPLGMSKQETEPLRYKFFAPAGLGTPI